MGRVAYSSCMSLYNLATLNVGSTVTSSAKFWRRKRPWMSTTVECSSQLYWTAGWQPPPILRAQLPCAAARRNGREKSAESPSESMTTILATFIFTR